jgi:hypothetical protein
MRNVLVKVDNDFLTVDSYEPYGCQMKAVMFTKLYAEVAK